MPPTRTRAELTAKARALASSGAARSIRIHANLTLADVAEEVGCAQNTIWRFENGQSRPSSAIAPRYCRVLESLERGMWS